MEGAGRKGGREKEVRVRCEEGTGHGVATAGDEGGRGMRLGYRAESSPSQSIRMGLTGAPLLALTRFVLVLVRVA